MAVSTAEFEKVLLSLEEALQLHSAFTDLAQKKLARDACIQRFEFCIELAWKTSARTLGSSSTAANTVIREMARDGLISNPEEWFEYIVARNQTSHSYDDNVAGKVFATILKFLPEAKRLLANLKSKLNSA